MKKSIVFVVMLALTFPSYGQPLGKDTKAELDQYYNRIRTYKRIGTATLITGGAVATVGGILWLSEFGDGLPGGTGYNEGVSNTGEVLFYTGLGVAVASAVFLESYRKKNRIMKGLPAVPFVAMETAPQPRATGITRSRYPCLGLQVEL